jgi:hypothetical protein
VAQREDSDRSVVALASGRLQRPDDLRAILRTADDGEREAGVARSEGPALTGRTGVQNRQGAIVRLRHPLHVTQVEEPAVMVEPPRCGPDLLDDVPPLLRERIPVVVVMRQLDAERVVLGLVPSGDDVDASTAPADLVDRRQLLRHHHRVVERGVDRREDRDAASVREETGRPRRRVQDTLVEVGLAAIADPPRDGEQEVDPDLIGEERESQVVLPAPRPPRANMARLGAAIPGRTPA